MRKLFVCLTLTLSFLLLLVAIPSRSEADVRVGVSIVDGDLRSFHFSAGNYYPVPRREVVIIRERYIPDYDYDYDYERPVVIVTQRRVRVAPVTIIKECDMDEDDDRDHRVILRELRKHRKDHKKIIKVHRPRYRRNYDYDDD